LLVADTAEAAAERTMKVATGEAHRMVQVVIWSIEHVGELIDEP